MPSSSQDAYRSVQAQQPHKPPASHQLSPSLWETSEGVTLSLCMSSLLTEQPERPGGLSSDDCHSEPRPGPQRSQQLLHPEVGLKKASPLTVHASVLSAHLSCVCVWCGCVSVCVGVTTHWPSSTATPPWSTTTSTTAS